MSHPPYDPTPQSQPAAGPASAQKSVYQRPWFAVLALLLVVGVIGSALNGGDDEAQATAAATSTSAAEQPASQPSAAAVETPAVSSPAASSPSQPAPVAPVVDFTMPDFVGLDLQTAQNLVQSNNVFLSVSHDLLGNRNQLVDSNWMVCTQNIPPGQRVTGDVEGQIDFGVVKREESCP